MHIIEEFTEYDELFEHYRFIIDKGQGALRIDKYLVNRLENISRTRIQSAAEAGNILVNSIPVKSNYRVKPNDIISIVLPHPPQTLELIPEDIAIEIVYEDDYLIVINKKPGMVVHPGLGNYKGTLVNALMYHLRDNPLFNSGQLRPGLVHRIDKDTSGLLVVAKNEIAMNKLAKQFFEKTVNRTYIAVVWGNLKLQEGTISGNIGRNPRDRKKMYVFNDETKGKSAITHYSVKERLRYVTVVECRLETGRTHQIRVHFQYIKHPLFNDPDYGGNKILRGTTFNNYKQFIENCFEILPRQALHAKSLSFLHPENDREIHFDSEIPQDMAQVIDKWRKYTNTGQLH